MRKLNCIILFLSMALMYSHAQPAKQASVKELLHLMKQDSIVEKRATFTIPTILKEIQHGQDSVLMEYTMQKAKEICLKIINEDMVDLYSKYFSEKEINDIIAFYKTPTAQKLVSLMPEITKELMITAMGKYVLELMKEVHHKVKSLEGKTVE